MVHFPKSRQGTELWERRAAAKHIPALAVIRR